MKMLRSKFLRDSVKLISSALLLGGLAVGCGSDASDPEAITLDELKAPGNLWIQDGGNGNATLYWTGSNNEDDFDGYNVYGMNKTKIGDDYKAGQAIELLDEAGEPVAAAKDFLAKFNYDPAKPFEEPAAAATDGEEKFSALPIHQKNGEEGIFPTCGVESGVCKNHSTTFARATVEDNSARGVNGTVSYPITGLKVGETYCFLVLSSMDEGQKVSMTSTNLACVTPKFQATFDITVPDASNHSDKLVFDLHTFLAGCTQTGCPIGTTLATSDLGAAAGGASPGPLYIEHYEGGTFTPGANTGIRDLGFYETGFSDPTLPRSAPALVLDSNVGATSNAPIINTGGYTPAGRSRALEKNHVYVIAVPAKTDTEFKNFYYHYLWVKGEVVPGSAVSVEMRVSKAINAR